MFDKRMLSMFSSKMVRHKVFFAQASGSTDKPADTFPRRGASATRSYGPGFRQSLAGRLE